MAQRKHYSIQAPLNGKGFNKTSELRLDKDLAANIAATTNIRVAFENKKNN